MNSKLSGQPPLLATITGTLKHTSQVDETWFKRSTWVWMQNSSKSEGHSARGASWLRSPVSYQKLINQSHLSQVRERLIGCCAIAPQQEAPYQDSPIPVDAANQIDQLKDSFLSTISHELRTPISTIKMAVQMLTLALSREGLLAQVGKPALSDNKIAHYLKILNDECNREISLITDLLDLQCLESATQPVSIQPIVLESYLHRIIRPFQEQAQNQQQVFTVEIPLELPVLMSDAQSLERILVELLTNACKYTPASETISVSLHLTPADHSGLQTVVFKVCNSGVELPPEELSRVFEKFYRIPTHDPHRHSGTGLGLALAKKLVSQLGGTLRAESANQQTCFSVELPINFGVRLPPLASAAAPAG